MKSIHGQVHEFEHAPRFWTSCRQVRSPKRQLRAKMKCESLIDDDAGDSTAGDECEMDSFSPHLIWVKRKESE